MCQALYRLPPTISSFIAKLSPLKKSINPNVLQQYNREGGGEAGGRGGGERNRTNPEASR